MGSDSPLGWKDGHGCLFAGRYFVIAGGVFTHIWKGPEKPGFETRADLRTTTVYDTHTDTWDAFKIPDMPYTPLRTTGACGVDTMFILSGEGSNAVFSGGEASRQVAMLRLVSNSTEPRFAWSLLPELPPGMGRWLAAAAVLDGQWLVLTGGTNTPGIEYSLGGSMGNMDDLGRRVFTSGSAPREPATKGTTAPPGASQCQATRAPNGSSPTGGSIWPRCVVQNLHPCECPPNLPGFKLFLGNRTDPPSAAWDTIASFPGRGYDVPNFIGVNDSLYIFGGWRANAAGMRAWQTDPDSLYSLAARLDLPVPITQGTNGAQLLRHAWKYTATTDTWERLADLPQHMCNGGTVVLENRYIVQLGSSHGENSFRVGSNDPAVRSLRGLCGNKTLRECNLVPEVKLQQEGIAPYYGDTVLVYDTLDRKYSRAGVLPYGLVTSHCGTNHTHIFCMLGEPRHMWNSNTEPLVQIARVNWNDWKGRP